MSKMPLALSTAPRCWKRLPKWILYLPRPSPPGSEELLALPSSLDLSLVTFLSLAEACLKAIPLALWFSSLTLSQALTCLDATPTRASLGTVDAYADDALLCTSPEAAGPAYLRWRDRLHELGLELNPDKTAVWVILFQCYWSYPLWVALGCHS